MVYAGLDIGTTGAKITLFEGEKEIGKFYERYSSKRNAEQDEIDANIILKAALKVILSAHDFRHDLSYVGVTSFGETFVLLDGNDRVLMPSILYNDIRGKEETQEIINKIGKERIGEITGLMVHEMFSLPKLLHVKERVPGIWKKVKKIMLIQDFVIYMLTGVRQIDYSLASRTMMFDVSKKEWSQEILSPFGIDASLLSEPVPTGSVAGKIHFEGIPEGITLINIAHDQVSVALGSGLQKEGDAVDGCGTCECFIPFFHRIPLDRDIYDKGFGIVPYAFPDSYISYPLIFSGGVLVQWFMDNFGKNIVDPYNYFEKQIDVSKPSNLLVSPHFLGSGTPFMNSKSKAFIYGLDISSTIVDVYQGILEGVGYETLYNIEILNRLGISIHRVFANGGGSKNKKWLQIKANILNMPVIRLANYDAGTIGSAIVVGTTIGLFQNYEEGIQKLVKPAETYYPDEKAHQMYKKNFEMYKKWIQFKERNDENK